MARDIVKVNFKSLLRYSLFPIILGVMSVIEIPNSLAQQYPSSTFNNLTVLGNFVGTATANNGLNFRTLGAWFGDSVNVLGQNVTSGGLNTSSTLSAAMALAMASGNTLYFPPTPKSNYNLASSVVVPVVSAGNVLIDIGANFSGAGTFDVGNLAPFQVAPIFSQDAQYMTYGSGFNNYTNIFQFSRVAVQNGVNANPVAIFGEGIGNSTADGVWGANFVGVVGVVGAAVEGVELDCVIIPSGVSTQNCSALSLVANGYSPAAVALKIEANPAFNGTAIYQDGIIFAGQVVNPVVQRLIYGIGPNLDPVEFIELAQGTARHLELNLPSFQVTGTPGAPSGIIGGSVQTRLAISAGTAATSTSAAATMQVIPGNNVTGLTNADMILQSYNFGNIYMENASGIMFQHGVAATGAIANYPYAYAAVSSGQVIFGAFGSDASVNTQLHTRGGGFILLQNDNGIVAQFLASTSASVNRLIVNATPSGAGPVNLSVNNQANMSLGTAGVSGESLIMLGARADQAVQVFTAGAASGVVPNNDDRVILSNAVSAAFTLVMPAIPVNGQTVGLECDTSVTLTVSGSSGQTIIGTPSGCSITQGHQWHYRSNDTSWRMDY